VVSLTAAASCGGCPWTAAGTPAGVDKAADKHTATGHPTVVTAVPVTAATDTREQQQCAST
jgi:hypothetical protein